MANIINGTDTGSGGLITTGDSSDELQLQTAETARVTLTNTAVVVNEGGNDVDFRVEGDTDANLLVVDASTDRVGIGTSSPSGKLNLSDSTSCQLNINSSAAGATRQVLFSTSTNTQEAAISANNATGELKFESGRSGTTAYYQTFYTNNTERMRITSGGSLLVGLTSGSNVFEVKSRSSSRAFAFYNSSNQNIFYTSADTAMSGGESASNAAGFFGKDTATSRSINAAGTVNQNGADYAEYMTKAGDFVVAKGDVVGINADGKITNVFADAISFCVKSTNPGLVGGDTWGNEDAIGKQPEQPVKQAAEVDEEGNETQAAETDEEFAVRQAQYEVELAEFEAKLEAERQKVDRIAFSGQVPVNVTGATAGQYIVPVESNGGITGIAVDEADMTLTQYMKAVGKVIAIEADGRAKIIVKVA